MVLLDIASALRSRMTEERPMSGETFHLPPGEIGKIRKVLVSCLYAPSRPSPTPSTICVILILAVLGEPIFEVQMTLLWRRWSCGILPLRYHGVVCVEG